jgi:hypothetical protein
VEEYKIYSMPYQQDGEITELNIPDITTGIKFHRTPRTWEIVPLTCAEPTTDNALVPCVQKRGTIQPTELQGGENNLEANAVEIFPKDKIRIEDLPRNHFLIFSAENLNLVEKCPGQANRPITVKGLKLLQLGYQCKVEIPTMNRILETQVDEYFRPYSTAVNEETEQQDFIITPKRAQLRPAFGMWLAHQLTRGHALILIGASTLSLAALVLFILCFEHTWDTIRTRSPPPPYGQHVTYVTTNRA